MPRKPLYYDSENGKKEVLGTSGSFEQVPDAPTSALPTEYPATYAAMQASITSDPTTKRDFFVTADETNLVNGVAQFTRYYYNGSLLIRKIDTNSQNKTPRRVVIFGDSITDLNGGPRLDGSMQHYYPNGFWTWANILSGQRFELVMNAGISGDALANMVSRFDTDVKAYSPDIVVVLGGVNNLGAITDATTRATVLANMKTWLTSIYDKAKAIGAICIAVPILPTSAFRSGAFTTEQKKAQSQINEWIRLQVKNRPSMVIADMGLGFANPDKELEIFYTNDPGGYPDYTTDGLHPAASGAFVMGRILSDALNQISPASNILHHGTGDANKVTNGSFAGAAGATGPTGWTANNIAGTGTIAYDYLARTDGIGGKWLRVTITGNANLKIERSVTGFVTGDQVVGLIEYEVESSATGIPHALAVIVETRQANATAIQTLAGAGDSSMTSGGISRVIDQTINIRSGVIKSPPITWTSNTGFIQFIIYVFGNKAIKLARATVVKVN